MLLVLCSPTHPHIPCLHLLNILLYITLIYFTLFYFTLLYFTLLYFTILYFTLLYFTILCFTSLQNNLLTAGLEDNDVIDAMSGAIALSLPTLISVPGTICGLGGPDPEASGDLFHS